MDFSARFLLVKAPSDEALQERLEKSGKDASAIQKIIEQLPEALSESKVDELFDTTIINEDLEEAAKATSAHIYEKEGEAAEGDDLPNGKEGDDPDTQMNGAGEDEA